MFSDFYSTRLHRQNTHKTQSVLETKTKDVTQLMGAIDDESLREELETCKQFPVASEIENGRPRIFNFAIGIMDAQTLSQEVDTMFEKLKCAANWNVAFDFVLKNVEDGTCHYYYGNDNNTFIER